MPTWVFFYIDFIAKFSKLYFCSVVNHFNFIMLILLTPNSILLVEGKAGP